MKNINCEKIIIHREDMEHTYFIRVVPLFLPFRVEFYFFDTADNTAMDIFKKNGLNVHYKNTYDNPEEPYILIHCSIWKKDECKFIQCIDQLADQITTSGHPDYSEFCRNAISDNVNIITTEEEIDNE